MIRFNRVNGSKIMPKFVNACKFLFFCTEKPDLLMHLSREILPENKENEYNINVLTEIHFSQKNVERD